jgi:hypothetical protein
MYPELAARVAYERESHEEERQKATLGQTQWLSLGSVVIGLIAFSRLLIWLKQAR